VFPARLRADSCQRPITVALWLIIFHSKQPVIMFNLYFLDIVLCLDVHSSGEMLVTGSKVLSFMSINQQFYINEGKRMTMKLMNQRPS
jgi:hypothetical protein